MSEETIFYSRLKQEIEKVESRLIKLNGNWVTLEMLYTIIRMVQNLQEHVSLKLQSTFMSHLSF